MWRLILLLLFAIVTSSVRFQNMPRPVFGVKVGLQPTGDMLLFFVSLYNGHSYSQVRYMNRTEFFNLIAGRTKSPYNMSRKNLFLDFDVDCRFIYSEDSISQYPQCFPMDSLWKLKYSVHPVINAAGEGWAGETESPSILQAKYLFEEYGLKNIQTEFFTDTAFYKILRDVNNPEWIARYKTLK